MTGDRHPSAVQLAEIADEALAALDAGRQIALFSERYPGFDLATAYKVTATLRARRRARGERPVGRKIGFTNRNIWAEYGVYAPIWGDVYDTTLHGLDQLEGGFALGRLLEPRIEPEIAFGLARAPEPDMDEAALLASIDWISHGFEIVHSLFPAWRFAAPDTVAAFGLHGAYLVGPRHRASADWLAPLTRFEITLSCDGTVVERGGAVDVLGGPLTALGHLVRLLAEDLDNPPLAPGEIVTTGTLTRARPVAPGQTWATAISGLPLTGIELRLR
jgi:2-oxo-3-hexenedioate decarboxylase